MIPFLIPALVATGAFFAGTTTGAIGNNATQPPLVLENPTINNTAIDVKKIVLYGAIGVGAYFILKKMRR